MNTLVKNKPFGFWCFVAYCLTIAFSMLAIVLLNSCSFTEPSGGDTVINVSTSNATGLHAETHEDTGEDEISVVGLSGLLADDQHVLDSEVVNAIENASPLTMPAFTQGGNVTLGAYEWITGANYFRITGTDYKGLEIETSDGTSNGIWYSFYVNSASPVANDHLSLIFNYGKNSADEKINYGYWGYDIYDATDGSEDGSLVWYLMCNGANNKAMELLSDGSLYLDGSLDTKQVVDTAISKNVYIKCISDNTTLTVYDGKAYFTVPLSLNGMNLIDADASVYVVSSSGTPTINVYNLTDSQYMLSTDITIDASEYNSYTATSQPVINTSYDDVATGDRLRIDVSVAGTGTEGLDIILLFRSP